MNTTSRFIAVTVLSPAIAVAAHLLLPSIPAEMTAAGGSLSMSAALPSDATAPGSIGIAGTDDGINPQPLPPSRRS